MDHKKSVFSSRVILQVLGNGNLSSPWHSLPSGRQSHDSLPSFRSLFNCQFLREALPIILVLSLCSLTLNSRYLFSFSLKQLSDNIAINLFFYQSKQQLLKGEDFGSP